MFSLKFFGGLLLLLDIFLNYIIKVFLLNRIFSLLSFYNFLVFDQKLHLLVKLLSLNRDLSFTLLSLIKATELHNLDLLDVVLDLELNVGDQILIRRLVE